MNYFWIGHCREGTSDKVWGLINISSGGDGVIYGTNDYVAFWGRRGKKLQTKIHTALDTYSAHKLCDKKMEKGYKHVQRRDLDQVYPEFEQDLEKTAVWAMLSV